MEEFVVPDRVERGRAIGIQYIQENKRAFFPDEKLGFFLPIPEPGPFDWLSCHLKKEKKRQNFEQFRTKWQPIVARKVYILPLGNLSTVDINTLKDRYPAAPSIAQITEFANAFFSLPVTVLPPLLLTEELNDHYVFSWEHNGCSFTFNIQKRINGSWFQLYTLDILEALKIIKESIPDAFCITSVTMYDLYPDPAWNYVFGQARLSQSVGIFSFIRFGNYFYNYHGKPLKLVPETVKLSFEEYQLFVRRSLKTMFHETCHMFGMEHCCYFSCPMNGMNNLEENDSRPMFLCPMDLNKLQYRIGFNVIDRYRALLEFYQKYSKLFPEEIDWLERRLQYIRRK